MTGDQLTLDDTQPAPRRRIVQLSQADTVLAWMRLHPETGITSMDAIRLMGCTRLAARIAELRAAGNTIVATSETTNGARYARYRLVR